MTCIDCGGSRFQNTDSLNDFWHRFTVGSRPRRISLNYDHRPRQRKSDDFFSDWWPLKLLFWPIGLGWRIAKLLLGLFFDK